MITFATINSVLQDCSWRVYEYCLPIELLVPNAHDMTSPQLLEVVSSQAAVLDSLLRQMEGSHRLLLAP